MASVRTLPPPPLVSSAAADDKRAPVAPDGDVSVCSGVLISAESSVNKQPAGRSEVAVNAVHSPDEEEEESTQLVFVDSFKLISFVCFVPQTSGSSSSFHCPAENPPGLKASDGEPCMWLPVGMKPPAVSAQLLSQLFNTDVSLYITF